MAPPPIVAELVERFDEHRDAYRSGKYNEAQLREEFLNPLFEALGWDVYNRQGYAEAYKEVIHEDAIKVGGRTKAPDYCFRVGGGVPTFFVEAKKPSVDIAGAVSPALSNCQQGARGADRQGRASRPWHPGARHRLRAGIDPCIEPEWAKTPASLSRR